MVIWHHISEGNYFSRGRWFHPVFVHVGPHHLVLGVANFGPHCCLGGRHSSPGSDM